MSFNDVPIVTVGRNDYIINFLGMAKGVGVNRMESADLSEKRRQLWLWRKLLFIVISNNTGETMTRQQRYRKKQRKNPENI